MNATSINWKGIKELPADGKVRTVGGMEAVHHPRSPIHMASVMVHNGDGAIRRIQNHDGSWGRPYETTWSHGQR